MAKDIRTLQGELDTALKHAAELEKENRKLKEDFAQQQTSLHELMAKTGATLKKEYVYRDDECRPVSLGSVCEKCGFDYRPGSPTLYHRLGKEKEGRVAHPIM